jgi:hypothetical protein
MTRVLVAAVTSFNGWIVSNVNSPAKLSTNASQVIAKADGGRPVVASPLEVTPLSIANAISRNHLPRCEIIERQRRIHAEVLQLSRSMDGANFTRIEGEDLRRMTMLYDREFFDSQLLKLIGRERLRFGFSSRMTRVAGKLITHYTQRRKRLLPLRKPAPVDDRKFEMVLSSTLLFQAFNDVDRPIVVTGLRCTDRLEAMQRVCEHELVHLLEMYLWNDSSCSGPRFQGIAQRYFLHTEHRHDLITQSERAARNFDIRVGLRGSLCP